MRKFNNSIFKIILSNGANVNDINGLFIKLYQANTVTAINEIFVSFDRLPGYIRKMNITHSLNKDYHVKYLSSLQAFLEKVFIRHCYAYLEKVFCVGVFPKPVGVFSNEYYSFEFLKTNCSIEFNVLDNQSVSFIICCKEDETIYIHIDMVIDQNSFNLLFGPFEEGGFTTFEGERKVQHYNFVNMKQLNKNGLIPYILIRVQEILKYKYNNQDLKFEEIASNFKDLVFKMSIENELNGLDFYIFQYVGGLKWTVEYYALKKLESKNYLTNSKLK
jgi:hypothetical protein